MWAKYCGEEEPALPPPVVSIYEKYTPKFKDFLALVQSKPEQAKDDYAPLELLNKEIDIWLAKGIYPDLDKDVLHLDYKWIGVAFSQAITSDSAADLLSNLIESQEQQVPPSWRKALGAFKPKTKPPQQQIPRQRHQPAEIQAWKGYPWALGLPVFAEGYTNGQQGINPELSPKSLEEIKKFLIKEFPDGIVAATEHREEDIEGKSFLKDGKMFMVNGVQLVMKPAREMDHKIVQNHLVDNQRRVISTKLPSGSGIFAAISWFTRGNGSPTRNSDTYILALTTRDGKPSADVFSRSGFRAAGKPGRADYQLAIMNVPCKDADIDRNEQFRAKYRTYLKQVGELLPGSQNKELDGLDKGFGRFSLGQRRGLEWGGRGRWAKTRSENYTDDNGVPGEMMDMT